MAMTTQEIINFVNRGDVTIVLDRTVNPPPGEQRQWIVSCDMQVSSTFYQFKSDPFDSINDFVTNAVAAIEKANAWVIADQAAKDLLAAEGY